MKDIIKKFNFFKRNRDIVSTKEYVIRKILGFIMVYIFSRVIGQAILLLGLNFAGYSILENKLPADYIMKIITYYGYIIHLIITVFYCRFIEKRSLASMGIVKDNFISSYLLGTGIGIVLVCLILGLGITNGSIIYEERNADISWIIIVFLLGGFIIQGAMEEFMCRGFLMNSLRQRVSLKLSIVISTCMFVSPHFLSLFQSEILLVIIGVVNLFLFSFIVSLLMVKYNNIWVSCAVHSIWNFIFAIILGINVSGTSNSISIFNFSLNEKMSLLNGGQYGVESGLICTIILIIFLLILKRSIRGKCIGGI